MPRAPPSSAPVSEMPDATPARSGRTQPTTRSVPSVTGGATPRATTTEPTTTSATLDSGSTCARHEPGRREREASGDDVRGSEAAHEHRSEQRPGDEPTRGGRPQPCLQRRVAQHELQILGDQEEDPEGDCEAQGVRGERGAEGRRNRPGRSEGRGASVAGGRTRTNREAAQNGEQRRALDAARGDLQP